MAVNLADYVASVRAEVNPPGTDVFPDASDSDWEDRLIGAFWNSRLDGFLAGYTENADHVSPGVITPVTTGAVDLPRELIQLIIFYAGLQAVRSQLLILKTLFKAQAGSVSVEQQQSSNVLRDVLKDLIDRRQQLWKQLSDQGFIRIGYLSALVERDRSLMLSTQWGPDWWVR